jgi:hypothetical protein
VAAAAGGVAVITGHKPNGYFSTSTGDGVRVEGETRRCEHCQYTWTYVPGSGAHRGWCLKGNHLLCGRPECEADQRRMMARFPDRTWSCMPFNDWNNRLRDAYAKDPRYDVLPSGIVIARA